MSQFKFKVTFVPYGTYVFIFRYRSTMFMYNLGSLPFLLESFWVSNHDFVNATFDEKDNRLLSLSK